jgi:polar amino acid transport system substrate-binding protein
MSRIAIAFAGLFLLASCASAPSVTPQQARSELAPTGKLRVGINYGNPLFARRDASGEGTGIAIDLARELGRRIGAPVEILGFDSGGQLTEGLKKGGWDITFLAYEPAREAEIDFAGAFAEIDSTYLVPAGSPLRNAAEVDREGVRVAVSAGGGNELFLSRTLKRAKIVRATGSAATLKVFLTEKLDALAGLKPTLMELSAKLPGSRVLDGRYTVIPYSAGTAKGREAGNRYLRDFIEEAKASGFVARSIEKNGIRGVSVAPPAQGGSRVEIGGGM